MRACMVSAFAALRSAAVGSAAGSAIGSAAESAAGSGGAPASPPVPGRGTSGSTVGRPGSALAVLPAAAVCGLVVSGLVAGVAVGCIRGPVLEQATGGQVAW